MTVLMVFASFFALVAVLIAILSALSTTKVEYEEKANINASANEVFENISVQERLMRWSVWPKETGSKCAVELSDGVNSQDGELGSRTVFFTNGKRFGYQEIVELEKDRLVRFKLDSKGPPHTPTLTFYIDSISPEKCEVRLHFVNLLPRPFNALWRFAGLSKWTRTMHIKDLSGLKAFSEPPHLDADGRAIGRDPTVANPYAYSG